MPNPNFQVQKKRDLKRGFGSSPTKAAWEALPCRPHSLILRSVAAQLGKDGIAGFLCV